MPQITAIIPVYNGASYICQAIESALRQRDVDVEVVVIDDGSTDGTWEVLESFGGAIRKVRQANAGHVKARNRGANLATAEWLAFLDADDEWLPDKAAAQLVRAADRFGMVYTNRTNFGDRGRIGIIHSDSVRHCEGDVFERLLLHNFVTVSSVILRRGWFERLGGFAEELSVCEDWDLWLRYTGAGGLVGYCPEPLTRYRCHASSMSNAQDRMCAGRLKVVRRALASGRGRDVSRSLARHAVANAWHCSAWHAAALQPWKAIGWYLRAASYRPWNLDLYKGMVKCCVGRG